MDGIPRLIEAFALFEPLSLAILFLGLTALGALWLVAKALTKR
jgi:hypothetical protein